MTFKIKQNDYNYSRTVDKNVFPNKKLDGNKGSKEKFFSFVDGQRAKIFAKTQPSFSKEKISSLGLAIRSEGGSGVAALRGIITAPIPGWAGSKGYPDVPNSPSIQSLGCISAALLPAGAVRLHSGVKKTCRAYQINDKVGVFLGTNDLLVGGLQMTSGISSSVSRAFAIKTMVNPLNKPPSRITVGFKSAGNYASSFYYFLLAVIDFVGRGMFGLWGTSAFKAEYEQKRKTRGSIDYLRKNLCLTQGSTKEALYGKTDKDFEKSGREYLRPFGEKNLEHLQKHGKVRIIGSMDNALIDRFVEKYLDKQTIKKLGKEAFIEKMKASKCNEMQRVFGDKGFKKVLEILQKPGVKAEEVDKIVLDSIDTVQAVRNKRIVVYSVGAIATALMFAFTGGIGALVLGVALICFYLGDAYLAYKNLEGMKNAVDSPPGRFDKLFPAVGIGVAVTSVALTVAFAAASIGSMGIVPLVVGLVFSILLLMRSGYHMHIIDKQKENYCEQILKKKQITLEEFDYICKYKPRHGIVDKTLVDKLPVEDRTSIKQLIAASNQNGEDRMHLASELHKIKLEEQFIKDLWGRKEDRHWFGVGIPGRMIAC